MAIYTFDDGTKVWLAEHDTFPVETGPVAEIVGEEEPDDVKLVGQAIYGPQGERVLIIQREIKREKRKRESMFDTRPEKKREMSFEEISRTMGAWNEDGEQQHEQAKQAALDLLHRAKIKTGYISRTNHRGVFEKTYQSEIKDLEAETNRELVEKLALFILERAHREHDLIEIDLKIPANEEVLRFDIPTNTEDSRELKKSILQHNIDQYRQEIEKMEEAITEIDEDDSVEGVVEEAVEDASAVDEPGCGADCGCSHEKEEEAASVDGETRYFFALYLDIPEQKIYAHLTDAKHFLEEGSQSDWHLDPDYAFNWIEVSEGVFEYVGDGDISTAASDLMGVPGVLHNAKFEEFIHGFGDSETQKPYYYNQ